MEDILDENFAIKYKREFLLSMTNKESKGYKRFTDLPNSETNSSFRWASCCFGESDFWSRSCEREKIRKQMQLANHLLRCIYSVAES